MAGILIGLVFATGGILTIELRILQQVRQVVPLPLLRLGVWLLAIIFLTPLWLWYRLVPPILRVTTHAERIDFRFRNRDYAEEFARVNATDVETVDQ
jgi:hypothetical protein